MARQTQQIKKAARKPVNKVPKSSPLSEPKAAKRLPQISASAQPEKKQTKPKIEVDLTEAERLAGLGLTQEEIALSLGISKTTFYDRKKESEDFELAIKKGKLKAAREVSNKLYDLCMDKNLSAIIWYEKTRRGYSDKFSLNIDPKELSDDELDSYIKKLRG